MNDLATLDAYGTVTEPATLTIKRLLPGPIDRVWAYLTDSDLRRQWLAAGDMELKVGSRFEFVWRNDELDGSADRRPEGFSEEHRLQSRITAIDPPNLLAFEWEGTGGVEILLKPVGEDVMLVVTHRRVTDPKLLRGVSAGWHAHLDVLTAVVEGTPAKPFWANWQKLREEYDARLPQ